MRFRYVLLAVIGVLVALGCFRLSKWQMDRLAQRRARNALLAERQAAAPVPLTAIPSDTARGHYRRVTVTGVFDYNRELALALRSREGSPGVYLLTPLRLSDGSTVLTNRGWVYAPDGMDVDFARWREDDSVTVEGFLDTYVAPRGRVTLEGRPQLVRRLVRDSLLQRLRVKGTLFPYVVVMTNHSPVESAAPARLTPPPLSDGPHLSYAFQWGIFGLIALVGMGLAVRGGVIDGRSATAATSAGQGTT